MLSTEPRERSLSTKHPAELPGHLYSFTLRKADEVDLGLQVCETHAGAFLCIRHVWAHGVVNAYNKLCVGTRPEVRPGDLIIKVNKVGGNAAHMLEECGKQLVSLTLMRGDPSSLSLLASTSSFNAEATEFVPGAPAWIPHHGENRWTVSRSTNAIQARVTAAIRSQMVNRVCMMQL